MRKSYFWLLGVLVLLILITVFWQKKSSQSRLLFDASPSAMLQVTPSPSASDSAKLLNLRLFFVALNDNGKHGEKIGCGDTVAPVDVQLIQSQTPLQVVMQQLLSIKQQTVGSSQLYNSLYQSDLQFKDATIKNGVATIHLTGITKVGGDCDNPRIKTQLEKTASQFSDVNQVQIFINDKPLSDVVSLK